MAGYCTVNLLGRGVEGFPKRRFELRPTCAMSRDGNGTRLVIGNRDLNVDTLIGHGRRELVTPLDETHGAALE